MTRLEIDRPVYTQSSLDAAFRLRETEAPPVGERVKQIVGEKISCTRGSCAKSLLGFFPFIDHIKSYRENWRSCLAGDITAGLTVGIMHIPMGFGYALLANVPPVYGLYTSFWCVFLYFLFGQSQHLSIGTMAITSIMVAEAANRRAVGQPVTPGNQTTIQVQPIIQNQNNSLGTYVFNSNNSDIAIDIDSSLKIGDEASLEKTFLITMMTGIVLILMSVFRLSKVVIFIPVPCVSGFTTAAAFHILTSQVKFLLGINIQGHSGVFKLVKLWKEIILQMPNTNLCDLTITICCFIILISIKEFINPKFKRNLPVPIPAEIIVVVLVTLVSYLAKLSGNYGIRIVREVPAGFVPAHIPSFEGFTSHIVDAFLIAIISFVISYSMVSTFSRKHKYECNTGQEMIAYGICHLIGSVFGSFPATAAPPRCTVLDSTGAKTQFVHMFTSAILLLTILVIGPLFEPLPNSCLSSIIIVALIPLFTQFKHLRYFWKISKYDFAIWLVTWTGVVFLDIDIGLALGVGFSITTIALQACLSSGETLSTTGHVDLIQPSGRHQTSEDAPGVKIFRFNANLNFVTQAKFKDELFAMTVNPADLRHAQKDNSNSENRSLNNNDGMAKETEQKDHILNEKLLIHSQVHTIVIDCSCLNYIDSMGVNLLEQLKLDFRHVGVSLVLASCGGATLRVLEAAGMHNGDQSESGDRSNDAGIPVYPTIQDAITARRNKRRRDDE